VTTTVSERPPPARLRDRKQMTSSVITYNDVSVRNPRPWKRETFFKYLEVEMARANPPIPHLAALAELAGLSPSTISYWKSGKQRPTMERLAAIAEVLRKPRRELWLEAGLIDAEDLGEGVPVVDPRLHGLNPDDEVVRHIMSLDIDETRRERMLNRQRQIVALRVRQDIEEIDLMLRDDPDQSDNPRRVA
jgi:transcriptional regulator with XRE-family HTH domain